MTYPTLTKTDYISFLACPQELWMSKHQPELMPPFSEDAQFKVEQGKLIDRMAQDWFKSGIVIDGHTIDPELIDFQKSLIVKNVRAIADVVLTVDGVLIEIFEVKAATEVKKEHYHDVAFQKMVFEKAGYKVLKCHLVHVNKHYVLGEELDLNELFVVKNISQEVRKIMPATIEKSAVAFAYLNVPLPKEKLTTLCGNKAACLYLQHYYEPLPEYSIFDIARIGSKKLLDLIDKDIWSIMDVPAGYKLSAKMREQVDVAQENKILIRESAIKNILDGLAYPFYFLDYETFSYVLPAQVGIRPYQQMVFQYSLHVIEQPGAEAVHHEYLLRSKTEPVENLIKHMKARINPEKGTVFVWNKSFEISRNKDMATDYPQHADFLLGMNELVYDLRDIFTKGLYHHPRFKGGTSLKKVLPVLCPELSYSDLEIQNGNTAVINWHRMTDGQLDFDEAERIFADLLRYCELDTWAMVRIWEELKEL